MPDLPPHIENIITEACWGVPGVGQLTGEAKLRAILEAAWGLLDAGRPTDWGRRGCAHCSAWNNEKCDTDCPHRKLKEAMQEPCQRCGGEGLVVKPDAPGIRTRWYEDCPDCKSFPPHAEEY